MKGNSQKNSGLTTRQWALYNFLKDNYQENYYISKRTICTWLPEHYQIKENDTRMCREIENDVRKINSCDVIQKIIVSNKTGYKIGSQEECRKYLDKRFLRDLKNLKLNWKLQDKIENDEQMRFTFSNYERNYIETFISALERGK